MAKKQKAGGEEAPRPSAVSNRDLVQRLNFLYQTSVYLSTIAPSELTREAWLSESSSQTWHQTDRTIQKGKSKEGAVDIGAEKRLEKAREGLVNLANHHVASMRVICNKAVMRMDPSVKRTICKSCQSILIPGSTSTVRIKKSSTHGHIVQNRCLKCKRIRQFPAPPTNPSIQSSSQLPQSSSITVENPSTMIVESSLTEETVTSGTTTIDESHSEHLESRPTARSKRGKKSKRRGPKTRNLAFFERAEHVVYRGNKVLQPSIPGPSSS